MLTSNQLPINGFKYDLNELSFYTVEKGDTLRGIAKKVLGEPEKFRKIMELNGLTEPIVFPGQILRIPENINSNIVIYRVKRGDKLWNIAERFLNYGPRYEEIMSLNGLTNDMIYPGQILKIAIDETVSPITYTVKSGDTLWKIAREFLGDGKRYIEIMKINNLENGNLRVVQKLNLPKI